MYIVIGEQTTEVSKTLYKIPFHEGATYLGLLVTFWSSELIRIYEKATLARDVHAQWQPGS